MAGNKNKIFTGPRARVTIGTEEIAFGVSVSGTEQIQRLPAIALNSFHVKEWVPVGYDVAFSMSRLYLLEKSMKSMGLMPSTKALSSSHLAAVLNQTSMSVVIDDSMPDPGNRFMVLEQAEIVSRQFGFGPRDLVGEDVEFVAIRMYDFYDSANAGI